MCDERTSGHPELWIVGLPADRGPEGNAEMWREAEQYLDYLSGKHEGNDNEAVLAALTDAYNRCIEERRRAQDLLKLHQRWAERPIGGVAEPPPVIVPKG